MVFVAEPPDMARGLVGTTGRDVAPVGGEDGQSDCEALIAHERTRRIAISEHSEYFTSKHS